MTSEKQRKTKLRESDQELITLVIPCRSEYVGLCRLVAGVMGARESLDEEDIADLKLVVTEACTCFLGGLDESPPSAHERGATQTPRTLRVDFNVLSEAWELTISDPEHRYHIPNASRCDPSGGSGLGLTIIRALVDSVEHTDSEVEGRVIRLVKQLSPHPASAY
jgi:anti-sigma regulatory factor (Ser/Thr protein kinase)